MKIPINIQIQSERIYSDLAVKGNIQSPEPETNSVNITGFLKKTKEGLQVEYVEQEDSDKENTITTISTLGKNIISVNRTGPFNSHMVFEQGKCHTCIYDTGVSPMQLRICTKELTNNLTIQGGKLNIDYSIEIVGNLAEKNKLSVSIYPDESIITS